MPWSQPAARMREFILAIRAIWESWATGGELDFEGDFYTHTLMAPFFNPGPNPHGNPPIMLAAVGPLMTETAGEVADGILVPRVLDRALPARGDAAGARAGLRARRGAAATASRSRRRPSSSPRDTEEEIADGVADGQAADRLLRLHPRLPPGPRPARLGRAPGRAADDDQARRVGADVGADRRRAARTTFAVVGTPEEAVAEIKRRYGDIATRITIQLPADRDEAADRRWRGLFGELRA